jgi:hypothetical protein
MYLRAEWTAGIVHALSRLGSQRADAQAEFERPSTERVRVNHDLVRPPDSQSLMPRRLEQALHLPVPDEVLMRLVFRFCTCWSILFCYAKA